jgi:hypothetical protein
MSTRVEQEEAEPLTFLPHIDWQNFHEANILHAY